MKARPYLLFLIGSSFVFHCIQKQNIPSSLIGTWQAIILNIGNISLDLKSDSLTLPPEYWQERNEFKPGTSGYFFDSLILAGLRARFKNHLMANQIKFDKDGNFEMSPINGEPRKGTIRMLAKKNIEFAVLDSNSIKPIFHFDLRNTLLYLSQKGEESLEVIYKKIN